MSSDLDSVLQSLEQQVNDFSLDISQGNDGQSSSNSFVSPSITSQHSHSKVTHHKHHKDDNDDDDDIIGHLLQSPTSPSSSIQHNDLFPPHQMKSSPKTIGLARSLSSGTRKFPKKLLPDEPVPSIPTTPPTFKNQDISTTKDETDDLQQAMQLAWAVLDADHSDIKDTSTKEEEEEEETIKQHHNTTNATGSSVTTVTPSQTMTTRIFIEDGKNHKTVQLTNVLTTAMVIQYLKRKELLDNSDDWTLFEIASSHGVERPLRLWEIVMDITSCWEQNVNNALLVKKYGFYESLTADSIRDRPLPVHGWLHIEYKKGKWQKRYCFIKDHAIYHAKDSKCANSAILCHLPAFDVYTLLQPCTTSPTPFAFALRAQDRAAIFEKEEDYIRLFSAENQASMESWVLGIRQAKSIIQYQQYPKRVLNPLTALTTELRRLKSTKQTTTMDDINNVEGRPRARSESTSRRITDETIKRKASTRGLSRNGTIRNHHDTMEENNNTTLIQIDDKIQFSKGSLLDNTSATLGTTSSNNNNNNNNNNNRMIRSKSTRETSNHRKPDDQQVLSHHTSIRRKDRQRQHDVPLPNTNAIMTSNTSTTLLKLNETPERFHTQTLLQRQMKPLLNFDHDSDHRR